MGRKFQSIEKLQENDRLTKDRKVKNGEYVMSFCQEIIGKSNEWKYMYITTMEASQLEMLAAEKDAIIMEQKL